MDTPIISDVKKSYVKKNELVLFLMSAFFYSNMTGMVNGYRQAYLVNVLKLESTEVSLLNTITGIAGFALGFFYAMMIDSKKPTRLGKFRPLGMAAAIPVGVLVVLQFFTPSGMTGSLLITYLVIVTLLWGAATSFGNCVNMVVNVMTPNTKERDNLLSFRGIASSIGNSAPLVIVLVIGLLRPNIIKTEQMMYIVSAALCGFVGMITMTLAMKVVRERITYNEKRQNPLLGLKDVVGNRYAWLVLFSEFIRNFRSIANYMGIFLAVALLGDPSKFILFGLPTGIGTFVGMLIVNLLLKKFDSKHIFIASGFYSMLVNIGAFTVGVLYFKNSDMGWLNVVFIFFLFLIGLQFGASNLLPAMFQADILEDLEVTTGKRLDASLPVVISTGSTIAGIIGSALAPIILYGSNSVIQYVQPVEELVDGAMRTVYQTQSESTKIKLLFFYTIFHGLMILLSGLPFFFYKLSGKERERVHLEVLKRRALLEAEGSGVVTEKD